MPGQSCLAGSGAYEKQRLTSARSVHLSEHWLITCSEAPSSEPIPLGEQDRVEFVEENDGWGSATTFPEDFTYGLL